MPHLTKGLKSSRKKSTTIPDNSSVPKTAKIEENYQKNIEKISKNEENTGFTTTPNTEEVGEPPEKLDGVKLLGDLLGQLRAEKKMTTLMACRKIKQITVIGNVAEIEALDDEVLSGKVQEEIKSFFDSVGLGMKLKIQESDEEDKTSLNNLLGGHLEIKQ